jgi:hypothetical protein
MARPRGHPKSGGRKKGTPNKATLIRERELAAGGELPLDHMLRIMRDPAADNARRDAMAKAAAPFCHPHLASTAWTDPSGTGPKKIVLCARRMEGQFPTFRPISKTMSSQCPSRVRAERQKSPAQLDRRHPRQNAV